MKPMFVSFILSAYLLVSAWNWDTHQAMVDSVYYSLPEESQLSLNLSAMEEGSVAPDKVFKDFKKHHYPDSYIEAKKWLENSQQSLISKDYNRASYSIGVMSHYIADSFSAPHYLPDLYKDHKKYEDQGSSRYNKVKCGKSEQSLQELMSIGVNEKDSWDPWLKSKSSKIPQEAVEKSTKAVFSVVLQLLNLECQSKTAYEEATPIGYKQLMALIPLGLVMLFLMRSIKKDLSRNPSVYNDEDSDDEQ